MQPQWRPQPAPQGVPETGTLQCPHFVKEGPYWSLDAGDPEGETAGGTTLFIWGNAKEGCPLPALPVFGSQSCRGSGDLSVGSIRLIIMSHCLICSIRTLLQFNASVFDVSCCFSCIFSDGKDPRKEDWIWWDPGGGGGSQGAWCSRAQGPHTTCSHTQDGHRLGTSITQLPWVMETSYVRLRDPNRWSSKMKPHWIAKKKELCYKNAMILDI